MVVLKSTTAHRPPNNMRIKLYKVAEEQYNKTCKRQTPERLLHGWSIVAMNGIKLRVKPLMKLRTLYKKLRTILKNYENFTQTQNITHKYLRVTTIIKEGKMLKARRCIPYHQDQ